MTTSWSPSRWGRFFKQSPVWQIHFNGNCLELSIHGKPVLSTLVDEAKHFQVRSGLFWSRVTIRQHLLPGLPNPAGRALQQRFAELFAEQETRRQVDLLNACIPSLTHWINTVGQLLNQAERHPRWITHAQQIALRQSKPSLPIKRENISALLATAYAQHQLGPLLPVLEKALTAWDADLDAVWPDINAKHIAHELKACEDLFARVETQALTDEQARAVLCFDNHVLVVASAGSGKTSTLVAKALYALHRKLVAPERIVMLAFNKPAADELSARLARACQRLDLDTPPIHTSTFHALGLSLIGQATGRKPDIPTWAVDTGAGLNKLTALIDELKDRSPGFRQDWDMFRIVFGRELPDFGEPFIADGWDQNGDGYLQTHNGERVRSMEECMIANWLFYNGVRYEYERPYEIDTATAEHRQYRPDFYYPDIKLYHEHFALNAQGEAPAQFEGYVEGVAWKRQTHQTYGTDLIETSSHLLRQGPWTEHLTQALTQRGLQLDPNPDRPIPSTGTPLVSNAELVSLIRSFISHAKSNCLTPETLSQQLRNNQGKRKSAYRPALFLNLVTPIMQAWDAALAAEDGIDFEDMLNQAADYLEQGRCAAPYDLVLADEFQDASRARARLCRALINAPPAPDTPDHTLSFPASGRYFFAVGDDWQSINRFAGADVSVMTRFENWFGPSQTLKLEQTFRCPQSLCDISSQFVSKNPAQLKKRVWSKTHQQGPVLQAFQVDHSDRIQKAIRHFLDQLCEGLRSGQIAPGRHGKLSVFILGRFNADEQFMPKRWQSQYGQWMELTFMTIHRSKGCEADYILLPKLTSAPRRLSFPDTRADDPVMALAMPSGDDYPNSEERRLFYVALTRARHAVALFTVRGQHSPFLSELISEQAVVVNKLEGSSEEEAHCPACKQGVMVTRKSQYGEFRGCTNYPACEYRLGRKRQR